MRAKQSRVLGINILMFLVEGLSSLFAHSTALLADVLDMAVVCSFNMFS